MNGRMYDPLNGRMLRPDNYVQDPTNTQSYNRYSYCWNNPMKYTDPSGELVWALPYLTINKRGIDFGVSGGVGVPGTFGVQGNVSYGTSNNFSASAGVAAGAVSGNVGWSTNSFLTVRALNQQETYTIIKIQQAVIGSL